MADFAYGAYGVWWRMGSFIVAYRISGRRSGIVKTIGGFGCQRLRKKLLCPDYATIRKDVSCHVRNHSNACTHEPKDVGRSRNNRAWRRFSQAEKPPLSKRKQIVQMLNVFFESEKLKKASQV